MKTGKIILLLLLVSSIFVFAQTRNSVSIYESDILRIDEVGTRLGKIRIGGELKGPGDTYTANQRIEWVDDCDYLYVWNMRTRERIPFCANEFTSEISNTYELVRSKETHTKGSSAEMDVFADTHYMIRDTLRIRSRLRMDISHGYMLKTVPGNREIILPYDDETNEVVITRTLLENNGVALKKGAPVRFQIEYWDEYSALHAESGMYIVYIPVR